MDTKLVRRRYHDAWNAGDADSLDAIMEHDVVNHSPLQGQAGGIDGFKQAIQWLRAGIPDLTITIEAQIAEGDLVATRWTGTGTHSGVLMGVPATGRQVKVTGIDFCRIADGLIAEYWQELDTLSMLQQIGAIPQA
jgi:steroid delta-isomerase-like uncharacterized protein